MIGIYKITNKINGHCYIGQSIDIIRRFRSHRNYPQSNSKYPLYCAFRKYGIDNFDFSILEECKIEELDNKEIYYIQLYDSYYNGYNQTLGGRGRSNDCVKLSKEDVHIIYDLLLNTDISQREIAKTFDVGEDTISEINQGKTRVQPGMIYPLRKNKNKYEQKYCPRCGKPILHTSTYCDLCNKFYNRVVEHPSREELKKMIRTMPFTQIAKQYNVSDKAIVKWCISEKLPHRKKDIKLISDEQWEEI